MATVRITSNHRNIHKMEWIGNPAVDSAGHIERTLPIPEEAYQALEREIAKGGVEGMVFLPDRKTRFDFFVDR